MASAQPWLRIDVLVTFLATPFVVAAKHERLLRAVVALASVLPARGDVGRATVPRVRSEMRKILQQGFPHIDDVNAAIERANETVSRFRASIARRVRARISSKGARAYGLRLIHTSAGQPMFRRVGRIPLNKMCALVLWLDFTWSCLVDRLEEIPPTMLTAMVRNRVDIRQVFPRVPSQDLAAHPMWLEWIMCTGLYTIGVTASDDRMDECMLASDGEAMDDIDIATAPSPLSQRMMLWLSESASGSQARPRVQELGGVSDASALWSKHSEPRTPEESQAAEWCLPSDLRSCESSSASSQTSSKVSLLWRTGKRVRSEMSLYNTSWESRVSVVLTQRGNEIQKTMAHPYSVSVAAFCVCIDYARMFVKHIPKTTESESCAVCGVTWPGGSQSSVPGAWSAVGAFLYERLHHAVCEPSEQLMPRFSIRYRNHMHTRKRCVEAYARNRGQCGACRFLSTFVQFLSSVALLGIPEELDTSSSGDPSHTPCQLPSSGIRMTSGKTFKVTSRWTQAMRFFGRAFNVMGMPSSKTYADKHQFAIALNHEAFELTSASLVEHTELNNPFSNDSTWKHDTVAVKMRSELGAILLSSFAHYGPPAMSHTNAEVHQPVMCSHGAHTVMGSDPSDLRIIQHALTPLLATSNSFSLDGGANGEPLHACSAVPCMLKNMLCGTTHELYYAMQWLRRIAFQRHREVGSMFAPDSSHVTCYRMLPRLLSAMDEAAIVEYLTHPYALTGRLSMDTTMVQSRRARLWSAEAFCTDTVDLCHVLRALKNDISRLERRPDTKCNIPSHYYLSHIRVGRFDRGARHAKPSGVLARIQRLHRIFSSEFHVRRNTMQYMDRALGTQCYSSVGRYAEGHNAMHISRLARRYKRAFEAHDMALRSRKYFVQLTQLDMARRTQRLRHDLPSAEGRMHLEDDQHLAAAAEEDGPCASPSPSPSPSPSSSSSSPSPPLPPSQTEPTPEKQVTVSTTLDPTQSLYASLYAFVVPVDTRVCVSERVLRAAWLLLAHNPKLWYTHRLLATMLIEMGLSSRAQRSHIMRNHTRGRSECAPPSWVSWVCRRRESVYYTLTRGCGNNSPPGSLAAASHESMDHDDESEWIHMRPSYAKTATDMTEPPVWYVFDTDVGIACKSEAAFYEHCASVHPLCTASTKDRAVPYGTMHPNKRSARRGLDLPGTWCSCYSCAKLSYRTTSTNGGSIDPAHAKCGSLPAPPFPTPDTLVHMEFAVNRMYVSQDGSFPAEHVLLPRSVVSFPDLELPTHYLLYELAVDPRVGTAFRRHLFLGVRAMPRSSGVCCVGTVGDGDVITFRESTRCLTRWIRSTVEESIEHARAEARAGRMTHAMLDDMMKAYHIEEEDLAMMIAASGPTSYWKLPRSHAGWEQARSIVQDVAARSSAYDVWLGSAMMELRWIRKRYDALTGKYGAVTLASGDAVPLDKLRVLVGALEIMSRLEYRTTHRRNVLLCDTLAGERISKQARDERAFALELKPDPHDPKAMERVRALEAARKKRRKLSLAVFHRCLKHEERAAIKMSRHPPARRCFLVLNNTTLREDVSLHMVQAHTVPNTQDLRTLLQCCALDDRVCPPYLIRVVKRPPPAHCVGWPMVDKYEPVLPTDCLPFCYPTQVHDMVLAGRSLSSATRAMGGLSLRTDRKQSRTESSSNSSVTTTTTSSSSSSSSSRMPSDSAVWEHPGDARMTPRLLAMHPAMTTPSLVASVCATPMSCITTQYANHSVRSSLPPISATEERMYSMLATRWLSEEDQREICAQISQLSPRIGLNMPVR